MELREVPHRARRRGHCPLFATDRTRQRRARGHDRKDARQLILDRFRLDGRVAIVTGAGKGIGAACAIALGEAGAEVVCAARTQADIDAVAERVRATGRRALPVATDVTQTADLERLVAATLAEFGRIDVLVNNAGGWLPRPLLDTSERSFEAALRFNVTSVFVLSKLVVPHMAAGDGGSIVNISSRAASMVQPCFTAYATAKAALSMMTRAMAPELAPRVRVNAIEVGGVETDALSHVLTDASVRAQLEGNTPMQRVGQPDDIAAAVIYLASDASSFVTGKIFEVDGGVEAPAFTIPFERLGPQ
jgi:7-alpha-hydroxysteroid dehydrogenase